MDLREQRNQNIGNVRLRTYSNQKSNESFSLLSLIQEKYRVYKAFLLSRMFWGRGSTYKHVSHTIMLTITVFAVFSGVIIRVSTLANTQNTFDYNGVASGTNDLLQQGGSISTVLLSSNDGLGIRTIKHEVQRGEKFSDIAEKYKVTKDTIRWATNDIPEIYFIDEDLVAGWVLTVPEINGVLYTVQRGDTLDSVIEIASQTNNEANRFNIIEFNQLTPPYNLAQGQKLFIPDGNLRSVGPEGDLDSIPRGIFIDPLNHPSCQGYTYSRGFSWYHNGVDLAKWDGCPIVAVANGVVEYAGWGSGGQGYYVRINHGGGLKTEYFHGNGEIWVRPGDRVTQNQPILQMGSTGYSTGTHLHFILWKDGVAVDPAPYVPYWRP